SPGLSATVVVTLANSGGTCALAAGTSGTFTIAGITNTATASSYAPTIKSSVDQPAASSASLVIFGTATQLVVTTPPAGATGGSAFTTQPVVTVEDSGGRTVANDSSSITIAIKAGTGTAGAALSGTATVAAVGGVATFGGLSIDKSGTSYQLHATDGVLTAGDSSAFNVTVGAAAKLAFTQQPAGASGGSAFSTQPKVTVQDAGGNTVTSNNSSVVVFTQSAGAGSVTGLATGTASSGIASLTVTGNIAGSVTIQAAKQGGGLATATSTFTVTAGTIAAATSTIGASPSSITANRASTTAITVQAKDGAGNNLSTGRSTIKLSTTDRTFPASCSTHC